MSFYIGIDIGSTAIKVALADADGEKVASRVDPTGADFRANAVRSFERLMTDNGVRRREVRYILATGYGRRLFREADDSMSEITANAVGAHWVGQAYGGVATVINIGGQDTKAIGLDDDGHVNKFAMNDKCAAGTGRFLDVAARNLEIGLKELGDYHHRVQGMPATLNSTCAVFAESEIIGLLATGHGKPEIVAGIHAAIAKRTARLARRVGLGERVLFDGGPALNTGLVAALEEALMRELIIPPEPQTVTAYGAALLGRDIDRSERALAEEELP
ncbi:acyl-CoA dehydratase activase [Alkalilimnicola ehrlichii]|uniref:acyl-CoA dehydratase activase n=1 Tax=Alkalilimnicola ehrlichii TaxID=351052 RepID=UPI003BA02D03